MSEYELTESPMLCGHCGKKLQLQIIGDVSWSPSPLDEDSSVNPELIWEILMCPLCERETLRKSIRNHNGDSMGYGNDSDFPTHIIPYYEYEVLYPSNKRNFTHLPDLIARSYEIALNVLPVEPIAFTVFMGRTLEALCADQNAKGRNLQDKIQDLAAKAIIPPTLAQMANQVRLIRNSSVHDIELETISRSDALLLRELCETILEYVYEAPAMLKQAERRFAEVIPKAPSNGSSK